MYIMYLFMYIMYIDQYAFKVAAVDGGGVGDEPPQITEVYVTVRLEDIKIFYIRTRFIFD